MARNSVSLGWAMSRTISYLGHLGRYPENPDPRSALDFGTSDHVRADPKKCNTSKRCLSSSGTRTTAGLIFKEQLSNVRRARAWTFSQQSLKHHHHHCRGHRDKNSHTRSRIRHRFFFFSESEFVRSREATDAGLLHNSESPKYPFPMHSTEQKHCHPASRRRWSRSSFVNIWAATVWKAIPNVGLCTQRRDELDARSRRRVTKTTTKAGAFPRCMSILQAHERTFTLIDFCQAVFQS